MLRMVGRTVLLGVLLCSCGQAVGRADTPEALFETVRNAAINKDWNAMIDCIQPAQVQQMEKQFESQKKEWAKDEIALNGAAYGLGVKPDELMKMTPREMLIAQTKKGMAETADKDIQEAKESKIIGKEEIDANTCRLKVQTPSRTEFFKTVKENGRWYWAGVGGN
jgi:hypothetical protein